MLHHSKLVVDALGRQLAAELSHAVFTEAYSLSKDEMVMGFKRQDHLFRIRIITRWQQLLLFFQQGEYQKESNAQPVFQELNQVKVAGVFLHKEDRSFHFLMENDQALFFKLYGPLSNILRMKENTVVELFRPDIVKDKGIHLTAFERQSALVQKRENFFITKDNAHPPYQISLDAPRNGETTLFSSENVLEVYTEFSKLSASYYQFLESKNELLHLYKAKQKRMLSFINKSELAIQKLNDERSPEEIGHLLMANLHNIKEGQEEVEVDDFYRGNKLIIALKPKLTLQENATYYYRKNKNRFIEINELTERLTAAQHKLKGLNEILEALAAAEHMKDLKPYVSKQKKEEKSKLPFLVFEKEGFEIWVGKNAANNDLLTTKYAGKDDLWMHAKGVAGSHVLIRKRAGKDFTKEAIEKGAQLAAYYSKAKGSKWVPVAYSLKKFVRKPKGAEPGQVVMEKEEVLMVNPSVE